MLEVLLKVLLLLLKVLLLLLEALLLLLEALLLLIEGNSTGGGGVRRRAAQSGLAKVGTRCCL